MAAPGLAAAAAAVPTALTVHETLLVLYPLVPVGPVLPAVVLVLLGHDSTHEWEDQERTAVVLMCGIGRLPDC